MKYTVDLVSDRADDISDEVPYVGLEDVKSGIGELVDTSDLFEETNSDSKGTSGLFQEGDVLLSKLRPYLAKAFIAPQRGACTTEFLILRPGPDITSEYLLYTILSSGLIAEIDSSTYGAKMPRAEWSTIGAIRIPLPPLPEQRAIVEHLNRLTRRIDDLIAAKNELLSSLDEKRRAIIARAVTRGLDEEVALHDSGYPWLGEIPAHWTAMYLKHALKRSDYGTSKRTSSEGEIAILRMGDIEDSEIAFDDLAYLDEVHQDLLLQPGDLLFNRTNSLEQVGKVGLYCGYDDCPVSFASYLVRFRCMEQVLPAFLNHLLNSPAVHAWARGVAIPAIGQANLSPRRYGYLPIALPSLDEQRAIVDHIDEETAEIERMREGTRKTIALLKERRVAFITAAVTGQKDLSGLEDLNRSGLKET